MSINPNPSKLEAVQTKITDLQQTVQSSRTLLFVHSKIKALGKQIAELPEADRSKLKPQLEALSQLIDANANTIKGQAARAGSAFLRAITFQSFFKSAHTRIKSELENIQKTLNTSESPSKTATGKPVTFQSLSGKLFTLSQATSSLEENTIPDITISLKDSSVSFTETQAQQLKDFCDEIALKDSSITSQTNDLKTAIESKIPDSIKEAVSTTPSSSNIPLSKSPHKKEVTVQAISKALRNITNENSPGLSMKKITKSINESSILFTPKEAEEFNNICNEINQKNPILNSSIQLLKQAITLKTNTTITRQNSEATSNDTRTQFLNTSREGSFTQITPVSISPDRSKAAQTPFQECKNAINKSDISEVSKKAILEQMVKNGNFTQNTNPAVIQDILSHTLFNLYNTALTAKDLRFVEASGNPIEDTLLGKDSSFQDKMEIYKTVLTEIDKTANLPKDSQKSYWQNSLQIVRNTQDIQELSPLQKIQYGFKLGECFAALKGLNKDLTEPPEEFIAIFTNPQISLQEKENLISACETLKDALPADTSSSKRKAVLEAMSASCSNFLQSKERNNSLQLTTEIFKNPDVLKSWVKYANLK